MPIIETSLFVCRALICSPLIFMNSFMKELKSFIVISKFIIIRKLVLLHYVMSFLKRVQYFSRTVHSNLVSLVLYFTLFNMVNVFINSILWFLKMKLMILCRVGRKMYYESKFEWWKFNKLEGSEKFCVPLKIFGQYI